MNFFAPPIMDSTLNRRTVYYNFRDLQESQNEGRRTVFHGLKTISYRALQSWTFLPEEFEQTMSDNGYEMSVPADCAKYLYQIKRLFERKLLTWYLIFIMDCFNAYICI